MTDRELLERAAKAVGNVFYIEQGFVEREQFANGLCISTRKWNPLTDDGDALRLAVKLDIAIYPTDHEEKPSAQAYWPNSQGASVSHGNDPYAATRRAIVRAAAAIGKELK